MEKFDSNGNYLSQFGSSGSGDGQFTGPEGVAVDSGGHVFVTDNDNNRVEEFDSSGAYLSQFGTAGSGPGQFYCDCRVATDSGGDVYVSAFGSNEVLKFGPTAVPVITTQPANQTVNAGQNATFTAAANGTPVPTVQWQVSTDGGHTFSNLTDGGNISGSNTVTLTITAATATQNGSQYQAVFTNSAGSTPTNAATLTVHSAPIPQAITITSPPPTATVGGSPYTVTATGGASGNPVTFSVDPTASSLCAIAGSTVSFTGVGNCVIDANQAGNANYAAAPQVEQSFTIGQGSQAIAFTSPAPSNAVVGGPTYTVTATGGASGNPVTFSVDPTSTSVCAIAGSTVSFTGTGNCTIDANQTGDANYNAAPQVEQTFAVSWAAPTGLAGVANSTSSITLSWNSVSNALRYNIFRSTTGAAGSYTFAKATTSTTWTNTL